MKKTAFLLLTGIIWTCCFSYVFALQPPEHQTMWFFSIGDLIEWINMEDIENFQDGWYKNGISSLRERGELLVPSYPEESRNIRSMETLHDNFAAGRTAIYYSFSPIQQYGLLGIIVTEIDLTKSHLLEEGLLSYYGMDKYVFYSDNLQYETTIGTDVEETISYIIREVPQQTWNSLTLEFDIGSIEDGTKQVFFVKDGFEVRVIQDWKDFDISNINDLCLDLVPLIASTQEWQNPFSDIDSSDWFYDDVKTVVTNGLFTGISASIFSPDDTMTRAMFTQVIANLEGVDSDEYNSSGFDDVPNNAWYLSAVEWAVENCIVSGYGNGNFGPSDNITGEQMAIMLNNYIRYKGMTFPSGMAPPHVAFVDEDEISAWALDAVKDIQATGIVSGNPGYLFNPKAGVTRSETAAIFARLLELIERE